jgi:glycosyltransferase involved in cell wall biosynthesis
MRILSLVPSLHDTSPGQRFRLEQWDPILNRQGIEIEQHPFEDEALHSIVHQPGSSRDKIRLIMQAFRRRIGLVKRVREFDAVYVFREAAILGPPFIERAMNRKGVPIVFDFDDAIFVPYKSPTNSYLSLLKFPGKTGELCGIAAHVMAGNQYLANYARRSNISVSIVPTTIDTAKYLPRDNAISHAVPVIGWSGSHSTVQHLDTLREVLPELAKQERFRLRVIGSSVYSLGGVDVDSMPWSSATELDDLKKIDVGLMPLPNDEWSKGKCGLKALQYMALGIPTVCSPVGVNTEIITDGKNGFLASTDAEWVARLKELLQDMALRRCLGGAGRRTVEELYSADVVAPLVASVFNSVCASQRSVRSRLDRERSAIL